MPSCKYIVNFSIAAHIYIVAVLHSLFISHILVFLVLIIQHIVPKIYTLGAKCSFYGVKYMMAVKKRGCEKSIVPKKRRTKGLL